jgi:hypothetical protein
VTPLGSPFDEALDVQTAFIKTVSVIATRGSTTETLVPSGGQITADARRSMRWDGSLSIPVETDLLPTTPDDLLTPFGTLVQVRFGVVLAAGVTADVPFGTFYIDASDVVITPDQRLVRLTLIDLADRIAQYRFESPFTVAAGTDLADAVNAVVSNRLGITAGLDATGSTLGRPRVFGLEPQTDPWRELGDLAAGFGYRLWFDRTGSLVLDQPPVPDAAAAVALPGELTVAGTFDHRPANVVVTRGEASDDTPPIQAVAMDNDPQSPTYAGATVGSSAYGRVTRYFASPLLTTEGEAGLAAQSILATEAGAAATWAVGKAYDPTIDPDDVLTVDLGGGLSLPLAVDAVTVGVTGATQIAARALSTLSE